MKKTFLFAPLLLAACMNAYQPELTRQPSDPVKYEADRQQCISIAKQRVRNSVNAGNTLAVGGFGIIGATAVAATDNSDYTRSPRDMTDECLRAKGYAVK